jgi:serine protease Do
MDYRTSRIFPGLAVTAMLAIMLSGSSARPAARQYEQQYEQPAFRIVTSNVGDVVTEDVTPQIADQLHMSHAQGVVITDILYTPLQPGDVILAINGHPVNCQVELYDQLSQLGSEQTFTISVLRGDGIQTITVQRAMQPPVARVLEPTVETRGMSVATLSSEDGVFIADVLIGTPASDMGLKTGDIILDVDGHRVHSAGEFHQFISQLGNRQATLNVRQRNGDVNVFVVPS